MAENTNNSLSDLSNDGNNKFNRLLKDSDITKLSANQDTNASLDTENNGLRSKLQGAKNNTEKNQLTSKIENNTNKINNNTNVSTSPTGFDFDSNLSLFDRDAMIDYGRYLNADGSVKSNWKEYNKSNDEYLLNNTAKINSPVLFKDNSLFSNSNNPDFSNEGLSIPKLITWSEKYPALQLRYQDFVYCKKLGYYPNNRLIILRRFKGGVPDNLFDYYRKDTAKVEFTQPLSTMITWLNPEDEIIDMEFNENWESYNSSFISTIKNSINSMLKKDTSSDGINVPTEGFEDLITSLSLDAFSNVNKNFKREDGVPYTRSSLGNPNLINKAMRRKTGGDGLESNISFSLKFEYELRYINKIDPSIALLDLMSNAMRMGTSESEFKYNIPFLKESDLIKGFVNGDISKATEMFEKNIKKFTDDLSKNLTDIINNTKTLVKNTVDKGASGLLKNSVEYIVSRYREDLKASLSVDTGLPSGVWHVTIGNPKAPIISCGDLIISNSRLKLGKELGYNDFPNSFEITYDLQSARPRGRNELIRIFNSGRGRLYVYKQPTLNPDYDLYGNDTQAQNNKQ